MKIKSQKIIRQNGKVKENFVNKFNAKGLIERTEFLDEHGQLKFYSEFVYDSNNNCILKKEYDNKNDIQSSNQWEFDELNREIKFLELTAENVIWEWHEKQYPNNDTVIYISKDETGTINHKTIENNKTGTQERFEEGGKLYLTITKEYDSNGRLINSKTVNTNNKVTEENKYRYSGLTKIWELYIDGKFIKTEEYQTDKNGNQIYYVRKNDKGKSLEWVKREYDEFGNPVSIENGFEIDKPTHKLKIEIEYLKN